MIIPKIINNKIRNAINKCRWKKHILKEYYHKYMNEHLLLDENDISEVIYSIEKYTTLSHLVFSLWKRIYWKKFLIKSSLVFFQNFCFFNILNYIFLDFTPLKRTVNLKVLRHHHVNNGCIHERREDKTVSFSMPLGLFSLFLFPCIIFFDWFIVYFDKKMQV